MLEFFKSNDLNKSKEILSKNFNKSIDHKIFSKKDENNLMITTYNIHFFSLPLINIQIGLDKLMKFCKRSNSDIIMLQEALFNDEIIDFFKSNHYVSYVCDTYIYTNKNDSYFYGNIILVKDKINVKKISNVSYISGYQQRKKCIVNIIIEYNNYILSLYNVHLDVWDQSGKCRLEQIKKILKLIDKDTTQNIIVSGDFNSIKESDYSKNEKNALKEFYSTYTKNPFKELQFLINKGFIDVAEEFKDKISASVWSKQRVDFIFLKKKFNIKIDNYYTHHIDGSDHFPISIELVNPGKLILDKGKILSNNKKLVYEFKHNKFKFILKILPIWNKYWIKMQSFLLKLDISKSKIYYGQKTAYNEYIITKYMSKLVEDKISLSFLKILDAYKTDSLPMKIKEFSYIPNQKYYLLIQPKLDECKHSSIFSENEDLIVFQLQWALFISYKLFKFIHGDILYGYNNNLLCYTFYLDNKEFLIIKYHKLIWKFPIKNNKLPSIIMFDYEFSNFNYKNININNKIPFLKSYKNNNKKRELDILGYNIFLKKMNILKQIPNINIKNNIKLLDGFNKYMIDISEFNKLDPNKYLLLDGSFKKLL